MRRIIITGASGPLGVMLIKECIKRNIEVLAVVRPESARIKNIPENSLVRIVECDISNLTKLEQKIEGRYDTFYHLGWTHTGDEGRSSVFLQEKNIQYTLDAAKMAVTCGCSSFIGAGSQAEYGLHNSPINEDTAQNPVTLYGICKLAAGRLVMEYCRQQGIRCNWVRIFTVYGPFENEYILMSYLIRALLKKEKPILTPSRQIWDFLYCEDAVRALLLVGENAKKSSFYCLGSGSADLLVRYIEKVRDCIDPALELGIGEKEYGINQIMHLEADITRIKDEVGFQPEYTFEEGIKKTITWYRQNMQDK